MSVDSRAVEVFLIVTQSEEARYAGMGNRPQVLVEERETPLRR